MVGTSHLALHTSPIFAMQEADRCTTRCVENLRKNMKHISFMLDTFLKYILDIRFILYD